jgi:hypothetical protein
MKEVLTVTTDELRAVLEMITNYSFDYLQSLTKEELEKIYNDKRSD